MRFKPYMLLFPLFALIVALEIYYIRFQSVIGFDGFQYIRWYPQSVFPPGYPFTIWLMDLFVRNDIVAARAVSIMFHLGSVLIIYLLARQYIDSWFSLAAAALYGLNPLALRLGLDTLSESQYIFFVLLCLLLFERRKYAFSGLAVGAAYATRPEAAVVVIGLVAVLILRKGQDQCI